MPQIFESKSEEAMVVVGSIIIATLVLLALVLFKASFDKFEKYLIVREKFHSEAVQKVVDHVYPHHDQLKNEALRYLFWGLVWLIIAAGLFFLYVPSGEYAGILPV
ncbi:TPA: hypothetical protein I8273_004421 [Aeromonas hydrophila]|nr:hypothetical protein [Aeromonas hydrophila]HAT2638887.1 hypothetical protein [Aeromonas hydrophila]HAT3423987.1 hypothetical protein [Aeromonas hydrophila]HAT3534023.1 hypothetical protein [Aeromonas hydrophila]